MQSYCSAVGIAVDQTLAFIEEMEAVDAQMTGVVVFGGQLSETARRLASMERLLVEQFPHAAPPKTKTKAHS
jgi:hypothetical protein